MTVLLALMLLFGLQQDVPPDICDLAPWLTECTGGGSGDPTPAPNPADPARMEWAGAEPLASVCPTSPPRPRYFQRLMWQTGPNAGQWVHSSDFPTSPGPGYSVPGGPAGAVFAADGFVYQFLCVSASFGDDVWAEARRQMERVTAEHDPYVRGLTGLETFVWYSGDAHVEPFLLAWTDPSAGITWTVEAWAWINRFSWDFGDGTVRIRTATTPSDLPSAQGTPDRPAASSTYETTSKSSGFEGGFPFAFQGTWIGQYRWSADGGATWSASVPMANAFTDVATVDFEVVEVRSTLTR